MRMRWFFLAVFLAAGLPFPVAAQNYIRVTNCGDPKPPAGASSGYMDSNGNVCTSASGGAASTVAISQTTPGTTNAVSSTPPAITGFGTLAVTASSALASTATAGPNSAVWPTTTGMLYVRNESASAGTLYVCPLGGTCSATVGLELPPGQSWGFYKPATTMTVFATTTATMQAQW